MVESRLTGRLLLASPTTIWLNSYNQTFQSATGKGFDTGFGTHNLYSGIKIFQLDAAVEAPIYYGQLGVKSVQRFTGSIGQGQTLDISISPVDMSKSFITMNWKGQVNCYTRLTAPNNVQVYNSYSSTTYDFEVVELY
jgi:hypothetical protein